MLIFLGTTWSLPFDWGSTLVSCSLVHKLLKYIIDCK
jgi:hypothetical protein